MPIYVLVNDITISPVIIPASRIIITFFQNLGNVILFDINLLPVLIFFSFFPFTFLSDFFFIFHTPVGFVEPISAMNIRDARGIRIYVNS